MELTKLKAFLNGKLDNLDELPGFTMGKKPWQVAIDITNKLLKDNPELAKDVVGVQTGYKPGEFDMQPTGTSIPKNYTSVKVPQELPNVLSQKASKLLISNKSNNANIADKVSSIFGAVTNAYSSLADNSDSIQDIRNQESLYTDYFNGIGYTKRTADYGRIYDENRRKNTANAINTTLSGAQAGFAVGGPIGAIAGLGIGGALGFLGKHQGDVEQAYAINRAATKAGNENINSANGARGQYIRQQNAMKYGNQQDLILSSRDGKLETIDANGFTRTPRLLHTINGREVGLANAKVEPREYVTQELPNGTIVGNRYDDGKIRTKRPGDILYTQTNDAQTIWTNNKDPYTGIPFSDEAEARVNAGIPLDDLLQRMAELQASKKNGNFAKAKCGKLPGHEEGWLGNAIPAVLGGLASFGQLATAINNKPYKPNTYVGNPYEGVGLETLAGLRVNPYPIINQLRSAESRTNRAIDFAGGLSGGQRMAARLAALNTTQGNISKLLSDIQQQNNAYRANYAQAAINAGQAARQARMAANQWDLDYYSKAHAARNKGIQTGIANMLAQIQQYQANEFKRRQFNDTMALYRDDMDQRKKNFEWMQNQSTRGIGADPATNNLTTPLYGGLNSTYFGMKDPLGVDDWLQKYRGQYNAWRNSLPASLRYRGGIG